MGIRSVWFMLSPSGAEFDRGLYRVLVNRILVWGRIYTDSLGNVTRYLDTNERNLAYIKSLFTREESQKHYGIIKSGLLENGQYLTWPTDDKLPADLPDIAPLRSLEPKKTNLAKAVESLKKRFGHEVIKSP